MIVSEFARKVRILAAYGGNNDVQIALTLKVS